MQHNILNNILYKYINMINYNKPSFYNFLNKPLDLLII